MTSYVPPEPGPLDAEAEAAVRRVGAAVRPLQRPSLYPAGVAVIEWATIALLFGSTWLVTHPAWWLLVAAAIAARQHGLLILMHEGVHGRFHRVRWINDLVSDVLCAWPLLTTTRAYRTSHLRHHAALHSPSDPDWIARHDRPEWRYPKPIGALLLHLLFIAAGGGVWAFFRTNRRFAQVDADLLRARAPWPLQVARWVVAAAIPVALLTAGEGVRLLALWVVPFLTFLPMYVRIRVIAEHYGLTAGDALDASRDWSAGWLIDWWLVPWNIRLHRCHHLFPGIPFQRLPEVSAALRAEPALAGRAGVDDLRATVRALTAEAGTSDA
jgi:fatty acid desaturase